MHTVLSCECHLHGLIKEISEKTWKSQPDSCKTDTGKPPFKASEGGCFENLRVSEDITPSEFQQGKGTRVPIRPKVRLEASPNGLPMSVSSKVYATLRSICMIIFEICVNKRAPGLSKGEMRYGIFINK